MVVLFALGSFATTLLGGVTALRVRDCRHLVLGLYLGLFAGFLLYLATSDILPEAHASHPTRLTVLATVRGVGFIWLVVGLAS